MHLVKFKFDVFPQSHLSALKYLGLVMIIFIRIKDENVIWCKGD